MGTHERGAPRPAPAAVDDPPPALGADAPAPRRWPWRLAGAALTLAASLWVIALLRDIWPQFAAHAHEIRFVPLIVGFVLSLGATYLAFFAFSLLIGPLGVRPMRLRELAHLYFTAQLLKHLPGRVWGVGYQWTAARAFATVGQWVLLNAVQMALAAFFALAAAGVVLGFVFGYGWAAAAVAIAAAAYVLAWRLVSWLARSGLFARVLPRRARDLAKAAAVKVQNVPWLTRAHLFAVFAASWIVYYASWYANGLSYPGLRGADGVQLGAFYMIAWFAGYVSVLAPSGLGVRELVFIWLAKDFPADAVALMAVVGRVSLLLTDIALGVAFAAFSPARGRLAGGDTAGSAREEQMRGRGA